MAELEAKIINEIVEKVDDYEANASEYLSRISEYNDLFLIKRPSKKKNAFSNPRLTEMHRSTIALGTLMYRMMTAKDPFFSVVPMDLFGDPFDPMAKFINMERAWTVQSAMETQLRVAKYKQNLLKSLLFCVPFGTVVCQEDYKVVGVNARGRKVPVTDFMPRVMDQVAFDRSTIDIDSADWLSTMDVVSTATLQSMLAQVDLIGAPWNKKALKAAIDMKEESSTVNDYVSNRLQRTSPGTGIEECLGKRRELLMYYGKLDAMNDGIEYVAALINRKILIRFHANNFQHGKRPFRCAKWIDWAGPTGLGLGQLLGPLHKSLDANRQKAQDDIAMRTYSMWTRRKNTVNDDDLVLKPFALIDVEEHNDLQRLKMGEGGAEAALALEDKLIQEFRMASGATDTLQAIVTSATASEVALAQNEALRRISVAAEMAAESLVREHLEVIHANNGQYIKAPFNINRAGIVQSVYPADFDMDADFELKMTVDKDYKPERLEKLIQALQIITSTKSQHPDLMNAPVMPIVSEILYMLDVPPHKMFGQFAGMPGMGQGIGMPMGPMAAPPVDPTMMAQGMVPPMGSELAGQPIPGMETIQTPVGPVQGSAGGGA